MARPRKAWTQMTTRERLEAARKDPRQMQLCDPPLLWPLPSEDIRRYRRQGDQKPAEKRPN